MPDRAPMYTSPFRSPRALACFLLVAAIGLTAHLWTKAGAWGKGALLMAVLAAATFGGAFLAMGLAMLAAGFLP